MNDFEQLHQLRQTWPETENYLDRIGQTTNDLQVLREMDAAEQIPSWLNLLGIEETDLQTPPTGVDLLRLLHQAGVRVETATTVSAYQEMRQLQEDLYQSEETDTPEVLEDPAFQLLEADDRLLLELPELQAQTIQWARMLISRLLHQEAHPNFRQALMAARLYGFLNQGPRVSDESVAASLQSLLSASCYATAATLPPTN